MTMSSRPAICGAPIAAAGCRIEIFARGTIGAGCRIETTAGIGALALGAFTASGSNNLYLRKFYL
jgi:hypothetical protein